MLNGVGWGFCMYLLMKIYLTNVGEYYKMSVCVYSFMFAFVWFGRLGTELVI